jgi:RNA polymerase sigma-70 factor, ECF subfamily
MWFACVVFIILKYSAWRSAVTQDSTNRVYKKFGFFSNTKTFNRAYSYYYLVGTPVKQQTYSDKQLMLMVQETGDHAAFEILVNRHQNSLFGYIWRFTGDRPAAEDLFQETCMRIYQARASFKRDLPFASWAYRIATNACLDMRKKKSRAMEKTSGGEIFDRYVSPQDTPENVLLKKTKRQRVQALMGELSEKFRVVLVLMHYEGLSIKTIAAVLDIPAGTVKSRLHKGIKQLTVLAEKRGLIDEM